MRPATATAAATFILAFSSSTVLAAEPIPCTLEQSGQLYDLRPLQAKTDYIMKSPTGSAREYRINACGPVRSELWGLTDDNVGAVFRGDKSDKSMGVANTTVLLVNDVPTVYMTGGASCPGGGGKMSTAVRFVCDASAGVGTPKLLAQLPPDDDDACAFFVEWRTSSGCSSSISVGVGGLLVIFLSILGVALVAYAIAAVVYNRYVLGLRGADQLPSLPISTLFAVPALILSFFRRRGTSTGPASSGFRRGIPRSWQQSGPRSGYVGLPTDDEEAARPLNGDAGENGPFSLDDDEIDERDLQGPSEVSHHRNNLPNGAGMSSDGVIRL